MIYPDNDFPQNIWILVYKFCFVINNSTYMIENERLSHYGFQC